jgi:antitoxin component YwqK of YwqJK toxin-antitoxin module
MARLVQLLNNIFTSAILVFLLGGCSSAVHPFVKGNAINSTDINLKLQNGVAYFGDKLFTGNIFSLYPGSADTAEIKGYKEGLEHGVWKKFYEHGLLKEKREFTNGKKTGEYFTWWENGKEQMHYIIKNDEYDGTCREWNRAGLLVKEMNYKKGHEEGAQRWWYDNGKIKANYVITDGRRYGLLGTKNCINVSDSIFKN